MTGGGSSDDSYTPPSFAPCRARRIVDPIALRRWNRIMTRRVSKKHNHSLKIKAKGERLFLASALRGVIILGGGMLYAGAWKKEGGRWPVRARGSRSQQWYAESRVQMLRKKCRSQSLWTLHLAGDFHVGSEVMPFGPRPHMMRVMLISNLAVDQRFANGTQAVSSRSDRTR